jgi:ABC-type multidrug transport system ATPase subunit
MRVELHRVGKRFGSVVALRDVDLELAAGSRSALIGPNGSGKSTLVRLLMGMLEGDGEVLIDGQRPARDRAALARRIAYVPQIAPRLWAPVRDVVAAVVRLRGLDAGQVAGLATQFALDLQTIARRPFRALSGGMRQKVLAVLALASGAELLLLDEPTASMDPCSRDVFFRLLDGLPQQPTVLLCSHRLDEIRRQVDRVIVLAEGRVAWQGPAAQYLAASADAVVEVEAADAKAGGWLQARGFTAGRGGWWRRSVAAGQRAGLVKDVVRELDGSVVDLLVRDAERLRPAGDIEEEAP